MLRRLDVYNVCLQLKEIQNAIGVWIRFDMLVYVESQFQFILFESVCIVGSLQNSTEHYRAVISPYYVVNTLIGGYKNKAQYEVVKYSMCSLQHRNEIMKAAKKLLHFVGVRPCSYAFLLLISSFSVRCVAHIAFSFPSFVRV